MSRPGPLEEAIGLTREHDYLQALNLFLDIYGTEDAPPLKTPKAARGLSFFGLSLALVQRKYKMAIDLCKRAIAFEFYNGDHYANLARVYVAAGNRRKAYETIESALKLAPEDEHLLAVREELGKRARPLIPFLDRSNPINVTLGQARHARKVEKPPRPKK